MTMHYYIYEGGYFERDSDILPPGAIQTTQRPNVYSDWDGNEWVFDETKAANFFKPKVDAELARTTKFMLPDQSAQTILDATAYRQSLLALVNDAQPAQEMPAVPSNLTEAAYYGEMP